MIKIIIQSYATEMLSLTGHGLKDRTCRVRHYMGKTMTEMLSLTGHGLEDKIRFVKDKIWRRNIGRYGIIAIENMNGQGPNKLLYLYNIR